MKLAAWVAAKAFDMPIAGVDNEDAYNAYYERIKTAGSAHLKKLVESAGKSKKHPSKG